jgi:NAD(P)-dependent dehydrogenase (short-subunit alcohol dehydrogenase family)
MTEQQEIVRRWIDLSGKVAVVTGAGRGIGAGIAVVLAATGAKVVAADIDEKSVQETAKRTGGIALRCNVACSASVRALVDTAADRFGSLDIIVNNAGLIEGLSGALPISQTIDGAGSCRSISMASCMAAARRHA